MSALGPVAAGIAATFGAAAVISSASAFDSTMHNIQAVTKDTAAETAALGQELLAIGGNSVAGPQAVADAYYDIAGGVADASVRMDTLNAAIALSEAGQANLGAATAGLISVMNSYGFSADQAAFASDVFTQTVGMGVGTMDEFVAAMSPIAGMAAANGIAFDQLGSMMAYLTTKGVGVSEAATQIRAAMVAIQKPNEAMKKGLQAIGAESAEAALKQWGLEGTLGRLNQAFGGNTTAMAEALGSTEALNAATLINQAGYEEFLTTFQGTMDGVTDAARGVQLQAFSAQWALFQNALSAIATDIGLAVLPALNSLVQGARGMITDVQTLGLGGALQKWFNAGVDWLKNDAPVIFQSAMSAAVQLGTDVASWLQTNGPKIADQIDDWFDGGIDWLKNSAATAFGSALKSAVDLGTDALSWLTTNGPNLLNGIRDWVTNGLSWLQNEAPGLVQSALTNLFSGGGGNANSVSEAVRDQMGGGVDLLASLGDLAAGFSDWVQTGADWLVTNVPTLIGEAFKTGLSFLNDAGKWLQENGPDIAEGIGSWVRGALNSATEALANLGSNLFQSLFGGAQVDPAAELLGGNAMGIEAGQISGLDQVKTTIENVFKGVIDTIGGLFKGLFGLDEDWSIGKMIESGVEKFKTGPLITFQNAFEATKNAIVDIFKGVAGLIASPFLAALESIGNALASLGSFNVLGIDVGALGRDLLNTVGYARGQLATNANGTGNFGGGLTWVGERGPELMELPSGSRVVRSNQALGGGGTAVLNQHIYGITDEQALGEAFIRFLRSRNVQIEGLA